MKWEVKNLSPGITMKEAAQKVLPNRIKNLNSTIKEYLENETPENLHQVRIAVRRLRYNMDIFISCFVKKKFLIFYNSIVKIQDATGNIRDSDILISNIKSLNLADASSAKESVVKRIEDVNYKSREELKLTLLEFHHSRESKDFLKMLKK